MTKPKIIIVNEQDEIIGYKAKEEVEQSDIYRVSSLWIKNSQGDVLLAQRKFTKKHDPGKWGPAVAGTLEEGETYESNIMKEAAEEIGLKDWPFQKAEKIRRTGQYNYFSQRFLTTVDKTIDEFIIQEEEVEALKWFRRDELLKELKVHPDKFLRTVQECVLNYET